MKEFDNSLSHAHAWLKLTQIKDNVDVSYYRQRNLVCSMNFFVYFELILFSGLFKFLFYCCYFANNQL